jgi:hypothetical protein
LRKSKHSVQIFWECICALRCSGLYVHDDLSTSGGSFEIDAQVVDGIVRVWILVININGNFSPSLKWNTMINVT